MTEIITKKFNAGTSNVLKSEKYGTNWPVVYIINNNEEAYVGETTDVSIRSNQHWANEVRRNLDKINVIRERIINPLINFKSHFEGRKYVKEIVSALFEFLTETNVYYNIEKKSNELLDKGNDESIRMALENTQVWNMLMSIFDDMVSTIGEEQITFERFKSVFRIGVSNRQISVIPSVKDKVIIGDIERTRNNDVKVLFVIGVYGQYLYYNM